MIAGEGRRPEEEGEDERAALVLQLLLGCLDGQAPNLAHMLLGFDVEDGLEGLALSSLMTGHLIAAEMEQSSVLHMSTR